MSTAQVLGLFKLLGRHLSDDDGFLYGYCEA